MQPIARSLALLPFLACLFGASAATAAPVALDYGADDASCIDAGRFADEVSAKLGFVPWSDAATRDVRVRITRQADGFRGTLQADDGSRRELVGTTCADVTANLVMTVVGLLDDAPAGAPAPAPAAAPAPVDDGLVAVTFTTPSGRRIDITHNKAAAVGVASDGTTAAAAYFEALCTTPCTARLPRGRSYLAFSEPDRDNVAARPFIFDAPTQVEVRPWSGRKLRIGLFLTGVALAAGGIALAATHPREAGELNLASTAGLTLTGLGIVGMVVPFFIHDSFTFAQTPR